MKANTTVTINVSGETVAVRNQFLMELGPRLVLLRQHLNLFQGKMAEKLDISRAHLHRLEKGLTAPNAILLEKMRGLLNVSLEWLFTGTGDMITDPQTQGIGKYDFGKDDVYMEDMMDKMHKIQPLRHAMLVHFRNHYSENETFYTKILKEYEQFQKMVKEEKEGVAVGAGDTGNE